MRLSTEGDRDEARALAVLHAALDAGVRFFDTADAYCRNEHEVGHNERLLRRALESWSGDANGVVVATKGGLTRPDGRWVADGRARHLAAACEKSRQALGVPRIALYQLHAPDPRVPLATSVRALAALQKDGLVAEVGLCNVTLQQLIEARAIVAIAAVQLELSPFVEHGFRGGVPEHCVANGIRLIAHRPLGGTEQRARLLRDPLLRALAERHEVTPHQLALAWLLDLSPAVEPIPGPTQVEHAASLARVDSIRLSDEDRTRLDARFPAGRLLRVPRAERRPRHDAAGEVVLIMGLPGAGKSTLARELVAQGYERLNRDEVGGRLADLMPALERTLDSGKRRVVLDNTYGSRSSRSVVVETAWQHGTPVRCVWLTTSLEDAQRNAVERMVQRYGRVLGPDEMKSAAKTDPGTFPPMVQFRHQRELEPPDLSEGFTRVDEVAFARGPEARGGRAVLFWYDGVLRASRSGARSPQDPEDVLILPGRSVLLQRMRDEGLLLLGMSWQPEIAANKTSPSQVEAVFARTHELLGVTLETLFCPHPEGPPICWCRKPLPGLAVAFLARHRLDPAQCLYVGHDASDLTLARRIGFQYSDATDFFTTPKAPA